MYILRTLKSYWLQCLFACQRTTFKTTLNTFTARKGGVSLKIDNVDLLPDEFVESHTEAVTTTKKRRTEKRIAGAGQQNRSGWRGTRHGMAQRDPHCSPRNRFTNVAGALTRRPFCGHPDRNYAEKRYSARLVMQLIWFDQ
ncbi:hypothetical protein AAIO65_07930 [Erwinia amylovora]|uniref:hypothetical protein n=1 Tax=Erwinia amylovora TaxID=552 RepID=UPI0035C7407A